MQRAQVGNAAVIAAGIVGIACGVIGIERGDTPPTPQPQRLVITAPMRVSPPQGMRYCFASQPPAGTRVVATTDNLDVRVVAGGRCFLASGDYAGRAHLTMLSVKGGTILWRADWSPVVVSQ